MRSEVAGGGSLRSPSALQADERDIRLYRRLRDTAHHCYQLLKAWKCGKETVRGIIAPCLGGPLSRVLMMLHFGISVVRPIYKAGALCETDSEDRLPRNAY